ILLASLDVRSIPAVEDLDIGIFVKLFDSFFHVGFSFGDNQFDCPIALNRIGVIRLRDGNKFLVVKNIRTAPPYIDRHRLAFEFADLTWKLKQLQRLFECDVLDELSRSQAGELRLLTAVIVRVLPY